MGDMSRRSSTAVSSLCSGKPIFKKRRRSKLQFLNLPEDIQCMVLSGLPLKEVVRTSVLSSKWGSVRSIHPKLRFDGATMCSSRSISGSKRYTLDFIQNVNAVLQKHSGMFVKDFEVKFEFSSELSIHLDNWVRFVAASQTKHLAFDLEPAEFCERTDRYLLPIELLDSESTSGLQCIELSFVSIKLPSQLNGFPNLRKLDLYLVRVTVKDLQDMLSSCSNLQWLSIDSCHLDDELKVDLPLPRLLHLHIAYCRITKLQFNAKKLETFVFRGQWYPINLSQSTELKDVCLDIFDCITLEHVLTTFPTAFPSAQSLTLQAEAQLKMPGLLENPCKFSQLKYLKLDLFIRHEDAGNILSLASYLRAAPLIEKLQLYFGITTVPHFGQEPLRSLPRCPLNYLKNIHFAGFMGSTGQLEFLLHAVENAPVLEVISLDTAFKYDVDYEERKYFVAVARQIVTRHVGERILPTTKLCVL